MVGGGGAEGGGRSKWLEQLRCNPGQTKGHPHCVIPADGLIGICFDTQANEDVECVTEHP